MPTIDEVVREAQAVTAQPITWRRSGWEKVWQGNPDLPGHEVLAVLDEESERNDGAIQRSWLRGLADGDPVIFLAASTIWGYGKNMQWGPRALTSMLLTPNLAAIVKDIVRAARQSAVEGFTALFDDSGRPRIKSLSIAFGTKVLHFAGYDYSIPKPLILDQMVFRASKNLDTPAPVPDPTAYTESIQYAEYCAWAGEVAERLDVEPQDVEYALFLNGGR